MVLFGSILLSHPETKNAKVVSFLNLYVMVKSCKRRATLSTRDYPQGCQFHHSCKRLRFGVARDFGSLLRVVFDAAALFVSSFVFVLN